MTKFWDSSPPWRAPRRMLPTMRTRSPSRPMRHHPPPRSPSEPLRMEASLRPLPRELRRNLTHKAHPRRPPRRPLFRPLSRRSSPRFSTRIRNCATPGMPRSNFARSLQRLLLHRTQKTSSTSSMGCSSLRSRAIRPHSLREFMICRRARFTLWRRPCRRTPQESPRQALRRKPPQAPTLRAGTLPLWGRLLACPRRQRPTVAMRQPRQQPLRQLLQRPSHQTNPRQHTFRQHQRQRPRNRLRNPLHSKRPIPAARHSSRFSIRPTVPLSIK